MFRRYFTYFPIFCQSQGEVRVVLIEKVKRYVCSDSITDETISARVFVTGNIDYFVIQD
jgi:hypothetical protein